MTMNQNLNTSAPSAAHNPGTQETESTPGATGVSFKGHPTISSFIEAQFKEAASEESSSAISTAATLSGLGFTASANIRYAHFLEAYQKQGVLAEHYAERYPNCVFLPWSAFHETRKVLDLSVDLPEHYLGAVPSAQLPYLEIFELDKSDGVMHHDWVPGLDLQDEVQAFEDVRYFSADSFHPQDKREPVMTETDPAYAHAVVSGWDPKWEAISMLALGVSDAYLEDVMRRDDKVYEWIKQFSTDARDDRMLWSARAASRLNTTRGKLEQLGKEFRNSFFVVAPPEAFKTKVDWVERAREATMDLDEELTTPPDDPLVVRMVQGGCLIVAQWGDEAAHINAIVRQISKKR